LAVFLRGLFFSKFNRFKIPLPIIQDNSPFLVTNLTNHIL
jgi:hypothetical protein